MNCMLAAQPAYGLPDDPDAREQQETGLEKCGKILHLAVAVLVFGVGRLVGNADGKEGENGRNQVQAGVRGLGENSQTSGRYTDRDLEPGND